MTDEHDETKSADRDASQTTERLNPARLDRRRLLGGAAMLTVGGFGAPAALAQVGAPSGADDGANASAQLDAQTRRTMRWAGPAPADWVRPRAGADHNVVIVGGGQSGVAIGYGLKRKGVGGVAIIDQADPGRPASGATSRACISCARRKR
jgi:hypothetical protein